MKNISIILILTCFIFTQRIFAQCNIVPISTNSEGFLISGDYRVLPGISNNCNNIVRPLIVVEGFDPFEETIHENIITNANQSQLITDLVAAGFDIITLNFASTKVPLRRNAALLEELIDEINAMPSVTNDLVVMGLSMGGLIAKYTLSDMESRNKAHNARMYISMDSPHGGANVPASLRSLFSQLYNLYIFPPQLLGGIIVGEFITPMFESGQVLNSQAANEMILDNNANVSSFLSQLKTMNMPSSVNLAVANGSHAGQVQATGLGNNYTPGMVMVSADLDTDVDLFNHEVVEAEITARARYAGGATREIYSGTITQADLGKSRVNSSAYDVPLETMSGGFTDLGNVMGNFINQINNPNIQVNFQRFNFVSTYSAFGMDQRNARYLENMGNPSAGQGDRSVYIRTVHDTGFDDVFSESINNEHVTFSPAVSQWLFDKITEVNTDHCATILTQNFPISGPSSINCGQGYQKFSTTNVPGVNYNWRVTSGNWDSYTNANGNEFYIRASGNNTSGNKSVWLDTERICNGVALMAEPVFKEIDLDAGDNGTLSGPTIVCTTNSTFSLNNVPAEATVNWSRSSNLTLVSSNDDGITVSVLNNNVGGSGWVRATINSICGSLDVQKNFWVGKPANILAPDDIEGPECIKRGTTGLFHGLPWPTSVPGATEYEPQIVLGGNSSGFTFWSDINRLYVEVTVAQSVPDGYYVLQILPKNSCGYADGVFAGFDVSGSKFCSTVSIMLYPNPTADELTVEWEEEPVSKSNQNFEYQLTIVSEEDGSIVHDKCHRTIKERINMRAMRAGYYHVRVNYLDEQYSYRILKQ
ncbi:hypothetical protein [Marivirga sp.]|uniref:esterase/lipase family protein n=1 Tax=Marivirga sp. TaxID=2018662 RepID=UPI0025DA7360|nr:hypothetical protein [Marivirga sp.]